MKILYIGPFRFPNGDAAGSRVLNNAKALREIGHQVEFIAWGGVERTEDLCSDGLYRYEGFVYQVTDEITLQGNYLQKLIKILNEGRKTQKILIDRIGSYDVVIFYNGSYCITHFLLRLSKKTGVKIINDITEWYAPNEMLPVLRTVYELNMKYLQQKVPNKICISSYLNDYYRNSHNIVVPALCDIKEEKWIANSNIQLPDTLKEFSGIRLIYAGTPARKDALHNAINVINKILKDGQNILFLIIGTNRETYINDYSSFLWDTDLHKNIVFLGRVPQTNVPTYYRNADLMILLREPTRKSNAGFPTKFAESMISGTPVIANITSDIGRYLSNGKNGIVVPDYTSQALEESLMEWIPLLTQEKIKEMKEYTITETSRNFDYREYLYSFKKFMDELQ